jgi:6,7-dimethyl-8-ribityllumazine synthase
MLRHEVTMRVQHGGGHLQSGWIQRAVVVERDQVGSVEGWASCDKWPLYGDASIAIMGRIFRPELASKARVAIVVSRFNEPLTQQLLEGALAKLHGCDGQADVYWVPGAFEIPQACAWLLEGAGSRARPEAGGAPERPPSSNYQGICTLGCLIRGETDHYSILASEVTRRLGELSTRGDVPLAFGVLTCRTLEQAQERADPQREDKGGEVMQALLEMVDLRKAL